VLIYEFIQKKGNEPYLSNKPTVDGDKHLEKIGFNKYLNKG